MNTRLKQATAWDVDTIVDIEQQSDAGWSKEFDPKLHAVELLKDPKNHVHILHRGTRSVGYICLRELTHCMEVSHVAVVKPMQNKGYGRRMLSYAIRKARTMGKEKLILSVRNYHVGAILLYTTLGFQVIRASRQQVNNRQFTLLSMERSL